MMTTTTTTTDRHLNRSPRGGAVSPVNGQFYAGGQFMPMVAGVAVKPGPAPLAGSVRQVEWATRLRREALVRLDDEIRARIEFIAGPIRSEATASRPALRRALIARHGLMIERSASAVIEQRMAFA